MLRIPPYPGDDRAKAVLSRFFPKSSFEEIRAALMGNILGVDLVPPSKLLVRFLPDRDLPTEGVTDVREYMGVFMGLWNELATRYQDEHKPFSFTSAHENLPSADLEGWTKLGRLRVREVDQFLRSLVETNTPFGEPASADPTKLERAGKHIRRALPITLESLVERLEESIETAEKGASKDWGLIEANITDIDKQMRDLWPGFIHETRRLRMLSMAATRAQRSFMRDEPVVGRNDSCPCGSGKKFKKCCLQ